MNLYYIIFHPDRSILIREKPPEPINYRLGDRIFECDGYITLTAISECCQVDFDFSRIPINLMGFIKEIPNEHNSSI